MQKIPKILKKAVAILNVTSGIIGIFIVLITSVPIFGAGETALNFLRIGTSARGAALADSLVADSMNSSSVEYNPAGLLRLGNKEVQLMHISLYADIDYESAIYIHPAEKYNLSFNINYLHTSYERTVIDVSDPYGYKKMGDFVFQERCFGVTFTPSAGFWGIRMKYMEERIEDEKAGTVAADFGVLSAGKIAFAATLQNVGPEIKFIKQKEKLPRTLSAGFKFDLKCLALFTSANFYPDRKTSTAAAAELNAFNVIFLRSGYRHIPEKNGEFPGFTFGAGLKIRSFGFDYAFIPFGAFGNTQRFSLWLKF